MMPKFTRGLQQLHHFFLHIILKLAFQLGFPDPKTPKGPDLLLYHLWVMKFHETPKNLLLEGKLFISYSALPTNSIVLDVHNTLECVLFIPF